MSKLRVYNSFIRDKEDFVSLVPGHIGMYVCGPTVSGESHLGHARPYITFDVVFRYLLHLGYKVRYVRNITDAGHFEEEGREAVDKISTKAQIEKMEPMELVQKYTNLFHWAMDQFNCLPPSIEPTATGHIVEQINMIEELIKAGYAYEVNGSVYFDVKKYAQGHDYGKLSGRVIDDLLETTRDLEGQEEKKDRADFALWKSAPPEHIMRWKSPWGEGFPGWHIECSAMSTKYLGKQFDIHGGGMDLLFPHHESEIAQSTICNHVPPARYWIHNNMITINGKKMGKSYNNVIKLTELFSGDHPMLEKAYSPMTVRFFILQTHYRSTLDFGNEALQAAEKGLKRLMEAYEWLKQSEVGSQKSEAGNEELNKKVTTLLNELDDFINDDFNTAKVLANLFEIVPVINSLKDKTISIEALGSDTFSFLKDKLKTFIEDILGLKSETDKNNEIVIDGLLELIDDIRQKARQDKMYSITDSIRMSLEKLNIKVFDNEIESELRYEPNLIYSGTTQSHKFESLSKPTLPIRLKEIIISGPKFIFYDSKAQKVFLVKDEQNLYCVLLNKRSSRTEVRWKMLLKDLLNNVQTIKFRNRTVDFTKRHKGWMVSTKLFNDGEDFNRQLLNFLNI